MNPPTFLILPGPDLSRAALVLLWGVLAAESRAAVSGS